MKSINIFGIAALCLIFGMIVGYYLAIPQINIKIDQSTYLSVDKIKNLTNCQENSNFYKNQELFIDDGKVCKPKIIYK